jgi:hypothetical protein
MPGRTMTHAFKRQPRGKTSPRNQADINRRKLNRMRNGAKKMALMGAASK